jgi:hypothetical protein
VIKRIRNNRSHAAFNEPKTRVTVPNNFHFIAPPKLLYRFTSLISGMRALYPQQPPDKPVLRISYIIITLFGSIITRRSGILASAYHAVERHQPKKMLCSAVKALNFCPKQKIHPNPEVGVALGKKSC